VKGECKGTSDDRKDENMPVVTRIIVAILKVLFGVIIGAIAVPVAWFICRVLGLIRMMAVVFGGLQWLMFLGGVIFGALAGAIVIAVIMMSLEEKSKSSVVLGALGGAVGGVCSSVMFFPIVAIL
jgi:hypothetical protein